MNRGGGVAPGRERVDSCDRGVAIELLKAGAADNCNVNFPWEDINKVPRDREDLDQKLPSKVVGRSAIVRSGSRETRF